MSTDSRRSLQEMLQGSPYVSYAYSYPHKLAYRTLTPQQPLEVVWKTESRDALFLYLHIPFCEFRCGFCNLFTQSQPLADVPDRYLDQLRREAEQVRVALGDCQFARMAIGGGTPTFLSISELQILWQIISETMGADSKVTPTSVEASPATIDAEKLAFLKENGVERLSLGVQSFDDETSNRLGRPQKRAETERSLSLICDARFPILNLDLIYGAESQSLQNWLQTVSAALEYRPEEIYLYPLYVREQTGLGRRLREWDDTRLEAYRAARVRLLDAGYSQISFRMFARNMESQIPTGSEGNGKHEPSAEYSSSTKASYCCQSDGMVGLGCGARSYTANLHYSTDYAVSQTGVKAILGDYLRRQPSEFAAARHGIMLSLEEQKRRFVILSLLQRSGLDCISYSRRFGTDAFRDVTELNELERAGLAIRQNGRLQLADEGIEWSDAIGPWLASGSVSRLIEERAACLT